jgi:hypothetical protein
MVSLAPNSQGFVMTHMMHSFAPEPKRYTPNSIMEKISCTPSLSCFKKIIIDAKMDAIFSDPQADFTLFVVQDQCRPSCGADFRSPREIVRAGMFNRRITLKLLQDTPISNFINVDKQKVLVQTVNQQTTLNGINIVCADIICCNGIIHILNTPLCT